MNYEIFNSYVFIFIYKIGVLNVQRCKINLHDYEESYDDMIKELYVNFVIINEFLVLHPELPFVIHTYELKIS